MQNLRSLSDVIDVGVRQANATCGWCGDRPFLEMHEVNDWTPYRTTKVILSGICHGEHRVREVNVEFAIFHSARAFADALADALERPLWPWQEFIWPRLVEAMMAIRWNVWRYGYGAA